MGKKEKDEEEKEGDCESWDYKPFSRWVLVVLVVGTVVSFHRRCQCFFFFFRFDLTVVVVVVVVF